MYLHAESARSVPRGGHSLQDLAHEKAARLLNVDVELRRRLEPPGKTVPVAKPVQRFPALPRPQQKKTKTARSFGR